MTEKKEVPSTSSTVKTNQATIHPFKPSIHIKTSHLICIAN